MHRTQWIDIGISVIPEIHRNTTTTTFLLLYMVGKVTLNYFYKSSIDIESRHPLRDLIR